MPRISRHLLASLAAVLLAVLLPAGAEAATSCAKVASPSGSDSAAGSEAAPYRTAQRLVDSLAPGEAGCLRAGTYVENVKVSNPDVTLTRYPGEQATLRGRLWVAQGADRSVVEGLLLDGRNSVDNPSPTINADDVVFRHNDVTNAHTSICFLLGTNGYGRPHRTVIEANRIHDCGELPATNHHHGIYVSLADDTRIEGNWIYDNADRGIQLYPNPQRTVVRHNVIDGNGEGIIFGSENDLTTNDSLVEQNVITNATLRYNIEAYWPDGTQVGSGNVVRANCISGGARDSIDGGITSPHVGFTTSGNLNVDPSFVDRAAKDFRLRTDSPCTSLLGDYATRIPGANGTDNPTSTPVSEPAPPTDGSSTTQSTDSGSTGGSTKKRPGQAKKSTLLLRVKLAGKRRVRAASRMPVRARVSGQVSSDAGSTRVRIELGSGRGKRVVVAARLRADGSFSLTKRVRVPARARALLVRASVPGCGLSRTVRARLG